MPVAVYNKDYATADKILDTQPSLRWQIAAAIADERERCAQIAEAIDSGRGNEKEIVAAIRRG